MINIRQYAEELISIFNDAYGDDGTFDDYKPIESLFGSKIDFLSVLLNNGCYISKTVKPKWKGYKIDDEFAIISITNMMGNDVNEYYDYCELFESKYIIIFIDYFKDNLIPKDDNNRPKSDNAYEPIDFIGRSIAFEAICRLIDIFYDITHSETKIVSLNTTIMAGCAKYNRYIIAALILSYFGEVTDNDVDGCPFDVNTINNILSGGSIDSILYGARLNDEDDVQD